MQNTDSLIIQRIQGGDKQAFQELLDMNFKKSKSIIQKQYKLSHHDLEDIMQITSVKVWKYLKNFKQQTELYNWFYSIFKNEAIRYLYERNQIEENELQNVIVCGESDDKDNPMYIESLDMILEDTAKTFLEKKEDIVAYRLAIEEVMSKLKKNHKDIIDLILIQEKSYKEASDILNIPLGSVMSRLHYAKIEAQKIINEYSRNNDIELAILG